MFTTRGIDYTLPPVMKTGIIQPESVPGAFTANLRNIVTLYRDCVDKGAQIVLCPPMALSGVHTGDLHFRTGFNEQLNAALNYLAKEIMRVPLLICERCEPTYLELGLQVHILYRGWLYSQEYHPWIDAESPVFPLIETAFAPGVAIDVLNDSSDLLVALDNSYWHQHEYQNDKINAAFHRKEWSINAPVVILHPAGAQGEHILPGGSCVIGRDGNMRRLKLFKQDCAVIDTDDLPPAEKLPNKNALLREALIKGTADFITRKGYEHAYLNLLETPYAKMAVKLLKEALPDLPITAVIPLYPGQDAQIKAAKRFARASGITAVEIAASPGSHAEVHTAWHIRCLAEEHDAVFISALCATDAFTRTPALQAAGAADFIPLGELFAHDLKKLFPKEITLSEEEKESSHRLEALCNRVCSASVLLDEIPQREAEIRRYQRLIEKNAPWRSKLPPRLRLKPDAWPLIPPVHGLRD